MKKTEDGGENMKVRKVTYYVRELGEPESFIESDGGHYAAASGYALITTVVASLVRPRHVMHTTDLELHTDAWSWIMGRYGVEI